MIQPPETATLHLKQHVDPTPGQPDKKAMPIPLRTALIGAESGAEIAAERLILLDRPKRRSVSTMSASSPCCRSTATSRRR